MAGKVCPECGERTFHQTPFGRECSRCGFKMEIAVPSGKGKKCSNCDKFRVFNNICKECGAKYSY